jgi:hypothetical protein
VLTNGLDRLSYQSRWFTVAPERKFFLWLAMMVLAFSLPPVGQGACWLCWRRLPAGCAYFVLALVTLDGDPHRFSAGGGGDNIV